MRYLTTTQRQSITSAVGDIPLEYTSWQKWSIWLSTSLYMTEHERRELFLCESAKERIYRILQILSTQSLELSNYLNNYSYIEHNEQSQNDNGNDSNIRIISNTPSNLLLTLPEYKIKDMAEKLFHITINNPSTTMEKSILPSVFLLAGIFFYLLIYFKFPILLSLREK